AQAVRDRLVPRRHALGHGRLVRCDAAPARVGPGPQADQLGDLLLEGHLLDEVLDPLGGGPARVLPRTRSARGVLVLVHRTPLRSTSSCAIASFASLSKLSPHPAQ